MSVYIHSVLWSFRVGRLRPICIGAAAVILSASAALAEPECRPAGPISAGLAKLIVEFSRAMPRRDAQAPVEDFLVGVSGISPSAKAALARRHPTQIVAARAGEGDLTNEGAAPLQFDGIFAGRQTLFKIPQRVRAHYRVDAGKLTIAYAYGAAIELGERVPLVGIPVYHRINHLVVAPDRLLFYWDSNADGEADRCYVPS
ncbi:MAG TPA: hypothetical protein VGM17_01325 [Rhizomicrobium sp.]|jgi:hypothetical protein